MNASWKKAKRQDYDWFNPNGYNPYYTIYGTKRYNEEGVGWDLSVLKHDNGKYLAAHGSVILETQHLTIKAAKEAALKWFADNV